MKISILILNWNGKKDTLACLDSIKKLSYPSLEVIVIDNGSSDDSVETIQNQFPECTLISTGSNLGFAEGNNVGIRLALERGADYVLLLNNDTVVAPDLLEQMMNTFSLYPQAGILGAKIFLFESQETLDHLGGMWNKKKGVFELVGLREKGILWDTPQEIDYACGACFLIKREVIEKIGLLEPRFFLIWEESDFCFRARKAGFITLTCPTAHIWHKVSASFVGGKPHSTYFWWRNRLLWIERNSPRSEKWNLYCKVLIPDALHLFKLHLIKSVQLFVLRTFRKKTSTQKKEEFLLKNRAALCGIKDYCLRRFGNGPSWIYGRRS